MAHTKGPWVVIREYNVYNPELNRIIANCGGYQSNLNQDETHLENVANAQLCAAAPDLLAIAERIESKIDRKFADYVGPHALIHVPLSAQEIEALRAAIAKAKTE